MSVEHVVVGLKCLCVDHGFHCDYFCELKGIQMVAMGCGECNCDDGNDDYADD